MISPRPVSLLVVIEGFDGVPVIESVLLMIERQFCLATYIRGIVVVEKDAKE